MVNRNFISKEMVERAKVACYRFEGAAPHAVVLYLPGDFSTLREEEKNVYCTRLDCSLIYT